MEGRNAGRKNKSKIMIGRKGKERREEVESGKREYSARTQEMSHLTMFNKAAAAAALKSVTREMVVSSPVS